MSYISHTDADYLWLKRAFAYEGDGIQDIVARSAGSEGIEFRVSLNRDGEYHLGLSLGGYTIENAMRQLDACQIRFNRNSRKGGESRPAGLDPSWAT
jgi:hypothetical protein